MEIAIACWTGNGHTRRLAERVAGGIGEAAWLLDVAQTTDADWRRVNHAVAVVFRAPTYMSSVAAGYKEFMAASGDLRDDQPAGRPPTHPSPPSAPSQCPAATA